jgi:hypothetical protein
MKVIFFLDALRFSPEHHICWKIPKPRPFVLQLMTEKKNVVKVLAFPVLPDSRKGLA